MTVYRIAKTIERANDISGFGAFKFGGRWNSRGTNMLYSSINSSLAYLETLVHVGEWDMPPNLYLSAIELPENALIYWLPDNDYPYAWEKQDSLDIKLIGDKWIAENKFIAFKVRSAVNTSEHNFLLNPSFPGYFDQVKVASIQLLKIDARLIR